MAIFGVASKVPLPDKYEEVFNTGNALAASAMNICADAADDLEESADLHDQLVSVIELEVERLITLRDEAEKASRYNRQSAALLRTLFQ